MKIRFKLKHAVLSLLVILSCSTTYGLAAEKSEKSPAKSGYSVDGRTSASVLAAKRSHEVAKEDEIGLAVFSGLFVIAIIGFFSQKLFEKK